MSVILMVQIFWEVTSDSAYDNLGYFLRMPSVVANICLQNPYCSSQNKRDIFLVIILKNAAQVVMILLVYFKYSGLNFLSFFSAVCSYCQFSMLRRSCPLDIYLLLPRRLTLYSPGPKMRGWCLCPKQNGRSVMNNHTRGNNSILLGNYWS